MIEKFSTKELVEEKYLPLYDNINYSFSKGETVQYNLDTLFSKAKGEYINVLMDDDVLNYSKIENMMKCYLEDDSIALVTSYRRLIDKDGNELPDKGFNMPIVNQDTTIQGKRVGQMYFSSLVNFIGEPSTTLIKVSMLDNKCKNKGYYCYQGKRYHMNGDMAMWLECCTKGNLRYIREPLSYFRIHGEQSQNSYVGLIRGNIESYEFIRESYENKKYIGDIEFYNALKLWLSIIKNISIDNNDEYRDINDRFISYKEEAIKKVSEFSINI